MLSTYEKHSLIFIQCHYYLSFKVFEVLMADTLSVQYWIAETISTLSSSPTTD